MKMIDIIDKTTGGINLAELSKQNGRTEIENAKTLIELLAVKADFYDKPLKIHLTFPKGD